MADKSRSNEVDTELTLEQTKEKILEMGKKKGSISYDTIADQLSRFELDAEQMDEFTNT